MTMTDSRGLAVSTQQRSSLQQLERAMELSCGYFLDPLSTIHEALAAEPGFAMGHCFRAGLMIMASDRTLLPLLTESIEAVEALGKRANARERAHIAAARRWLHADFAGAVRSYGDIVVEYPRDLLALQIAHIGDFFLGASTMLRDRIAQVLPHWDGSTPGFGYVLGMHAFGLEETALYARAEDTGRRALELNARDPWAVHAVTHVMEMQGRIRDGSEWLTSREPDWAINNGFAFHNWWHRALFCLELGDAAHALGLFDRKISPAPSQMPLELIDASALLWRLSLRGAEVGARWETLAHAWEPFAEHAYYAFNDVHAVMAFAGAQRFDLVQRTIAALERKAAGTDTNAMMSREVGLPMAQGLLAFASGHYTDAVSMLLPIRTIAQRFGGSHAQRDVVHLTLLEAALRGGQTALARALASERTQLKPASPFNWQLTARALELAGDISGARQATDQAASRRKTQLASHHAVA
jgi:tetratricopeptide (TPR) repeat protein